jgi:Response regulator containing CheY-like receiver, AAA-type ATPase, and DNA-binding domains
MLTHNLASPAEQPGNSLPVGKKFAPRLLVIDDDRLLRWSVDEIFTARGWNVVEAGDARSGLQKFTAGERFDLVLLDLRLPDSNDMGVLARMRHDAPAVPVILMTAFMTREILEEATTLHAQVMSKPFDLDDLAIAADHAVAGRIY